MNNEIANTIEVLAEKVRTKEDEAAKLKKLVNELCSEVGLPLRYENVADSPSGGLTIRSDQFYGVAITTAIRHYLEKRKASNQGPASVSVIYEALRGGGYKFETANDDNAKVTIRNNLRKSSSIFHRLPNGDYGLLSWYPNAKAPKPDDDGSQENGNKPKAKIVKRIGNHVTHTEIKEVISQIAGNFHSSDVVARVKEAFPHKVLKPTAIPTVLHLLNKKDGRLKVISERHGKQGAVYAKA
jgi:hypothetical protein